MKFFAIVALFAGALAAPTAEIEPRAEYNPCPNGLYSSPVCADTDVLGLLCLNTVTPSEAPRDSQNFQQICAKTGKEARCAVLAPAGQTVLCQRPAGVQN